MIPLSTLKDKKTSKIYEITDKQARTDIERLKENQGIYTGMFSSLFDAEGEETITIS